MRDGEREKSASPRYPEPACSISTGETSRAATIRSMISTPRVDPIRHGVHLPQLSTAQNSMAKRAICAMSTLSSNRSEEHTSELQSLMRISYAVFCLKKKNQKHT